MGRYKVDLVTQSDMIMSVIMEGYSFPQDAEAAAMAQTAAKSLISCVPISDEPRPQESVTVPAQSHHNHYSYYDADWDTPMEDPHRKVTLPEEIWNFVQATWIPTLGILIFNPWASLAFTACFAYWWFKLA